MRGPKRRDFVYIAVEPGHEEKVAKALEEVPEVLAAYWIFGEYDILAIVETSRGLLVDDVYEAVKLVTGKLRRIKGVERTRTEIGELIFRRS